MPTSPPRPAIDVPCCPVCGAVARARLPAPGRWVATAPFAGCAAALGLARCRGCGFVFVDPRPDDATLRGFYDQQDYTGVAEDGAAAGAVRNAAHQLEVLAAHGVAVGPGTRLLDVGCGGGHLLALARARGAEVLGLDAGAPSRAACAARGLPVIAGEDDDEVGRGRFDVVVISHTLEHVPDLGRTLGRCRDALAADGRLLVEVPNLGSLRARLATPAAIRRLGVDERYRAFPVHLSYFTPATLRAALARHGLRVVATTSTGVGFTLPARGRGGAAAGGDGDRVEGDPGDGAGVAAAPTVAGAARRGLRARGQAAIKRGFFAAMLGENQLAIATRALP